MRSKRTHSVNFRGVRIPNSSFRIEYRIESRKKSRISNRISNSDFICRNFSKCAANEIIICAEYAPVAEYASCAEQKLKCKKNSGEKKNK